MILPITSPAVIAVQADHHGTPRVVELTNECSWQIVDAHRWAEIVDDRFGGASAFQIIRLNLSDLVVITDGDLNPVVCSLDLNTFDCTPIDANAWTTRLAIGVDDHVRPLLPTTMSASFPSPSCPA